MSQTFLGVAYYPEHEPESVWPEDAKRMVDLGVNLVRVGEFAWGRMQQPDGAMTLDWLKRLVDTFSEQGIKLLLCTPTAAPPAWLCEKFPDLPLVAPDGRVARFGGRRHYSPFHRGYREACREIAGSLAAEFGKHQGVLGWQIDNEVASYSLIDCSEPARLAWRVWLLERYETAQKLNDAFGLVFWSQEVQKFEQVPVPLEGITPLSPQLVLAYNRFCIEGWAEFIIEQARSLKLRIGKHQLVMASCAEPVLEKAFALQSMEKDKDKRSVIDFGSVNNYPELLPADGENAMRLDRIRGLCKPRKFLVPELQVGSSHSTIGALEHEPRRFWALESLVRGGAMLTWFHWKRFRAGCEWRHPCILERDNKPRATYHSLRSIIHDIHKARAALQTSVVNSDVQILYSIDNTLSHDRSSQPDFWMPLQLADGLRHRFPLWESETRQTAWLPLVKLGLCVDFVTMRQKWDTTKPLIVTSLDICVPAIVQKLTRFCEAGGRLILFPGVGERDADGAHSGAPSPGQLGEMLGVELDEYLALPAGGGSTYDPATGAMTRPADAAPVPTIPVRIGKTTITGNGLHAESLTVGEDTQVVGVYARGMCEGSPAIVTRAIGDGSATYLGVVPADTEQAIALYQAILDPSLKPSPAQVVKLDREDGARLTVYLNPGDDAITLGRSVHDAILDKPVDSLGPWGVCIEVNPAVPVTEPTPQPEPAAEPTPRPNLGAGPSTKPAPAAEDADAPADSSGPGADGGASPKLSAANLDLDLPARTPSTSPRSSRSGGEGPARSSGAKPAKGADKPSDKPGDSSGVA